MNINLHIEKLVLDGFARRDGMAIRLAVSRELRRLLAEQGLPANLSQETGKTSVNAGEITVAENSKPATVGAQVAQSIYGGMKSE